MGRIKKVLHDRKVRFVVVGVANTALNFMVLNFSFYILQQSKIVSSIIATVCAATVSFFLNRNFVFRHPGRSLRQPIMFAIVTLTGVLLLQNLVYAILVTLLHNHTSVLGDAARSLTGMTFTDDFIDINLSNLLASLVTMVWNYNGYRLFVFKGAPSHEVETEAA